MRYRINFAICAGLALQALAINPNVYADLIENDDQLSVDVIYPEIVREELEIRSLQTIPLIGVPTVQDNLQKLEFALEQYARKTYVPYVWGGNRTGSISDCNECVSCMFEKSRGTEFAEVNLQLEHGDSVELAKQRGCHSCQKCGVDCSNLANLIFKDASMEYPYLTSKDMKRLPSGDLEALYGLYEIGNDLTQAKKGDLVVQDNHIVILLDVKTIGEQTVSYIHSSRRGEDQRPFGGINIVKARPLESFQKTVLRILRHRQLLDTTLYSSRMMAGGKIRAAIN